MRRRVDDLDSFIGVAPSFEIVTCPLSSWMSLSIPRGPSVVRTTSTTAWHALMFEISCAFPCDVSVPSRSSTICGCIIEPVHPHAAAARHAAGKKGVLRAKEEVR